MSGSGKQGRRNSRNTPTNDPMESRGCRDIHQDLMALTSQVQMMSDSLAACKHMSKHRPLKKTYGHAKGTSNPATTSSALPPDQTTQDDNLNDDENCVIVSYVLEEKNHRRKNGNYQQTDRRDSRSLLLEDQEKIWKAMSNVQGNQVKKVDTRRMLEVIQSELKILLNVAPAVGLLVTALSDTLFHYKGCDRCSEKVSASLPWILSRIQNLVKYVTTKNQISYSRLDNHSYLHLTTSDDPRTPQNTPQNTLHASAHKIDALCLSEDSPGVQLVLHVRPLKTKKRFFHQLNNTTASSWQPPPGFPVVHLRNPESVPLVEVLVPSERPSVVVEKKRETVEVKEREYKLRTVFRQPLGLLSVLLVSVSVGKVLERCVEAESSEVKQGRLLNEKKKIPSRNLLENVPDIVREFLQEAEEEKMREERMRKLENGVKELKAMMSEVQKNQVELSKLLLKKGVYSQPLISLIDPNMLEKESLVVRLAEDVQSGQSRQVSVEDVQMEVMEMQQKCGLKNRMLVIVLNGLESNIPKEWWENMVDYVFNEAKPIEEFDTEKMNEMVERASGFIMNGEKSWREETQSLEEEEQTTEEEPNMKGNLGADVEDDENRSEYYGMNSKEITSVPDVRFTDTFLTFPVSNRPNSVSSTIKKLENQVSTLNAENDRLWQEVQQLKNLLNTAMKNRQRDTLNDSEHPSTSSSSIKPSGKSINFTIQIVDKDLQHTKDRHSTTAFQLTDTPDQSQSPTTSLTDHIPPLNSNLALVAPSPNYTVRPLHRHSQNDLNYLEDTSLSLPHLTDNHRFSSVLREGTSGQQLVVGPRSSSRELSPRPVGWVQSRFPMVDNQEGPSRVEYLRERPSVMMVAESQGPGLLGSVGTSRQLGTIPENESGGSWNPLDGIGQAIQQLRSRVRSIHKDVAVLKSKNDRIDKLLDRLMENALENSQSFEEMELDFQRLKEQLG